MPKRDEIGREREKKILLPNSVQTRLEQENSDKNSKKIEKIKKPPSYIIFSQNGMREKYFTPECRSYTTQTRKFQKNSKKIEKIKKPLSDIIFSQNGMR